MVRDPFERGRGIEPTNLSADVGPKGARSLACFMGPHLKAFSMLYLLHQKESTTCYD